MNCITCFVWSSNKGRIGRHVPCNPMLFISAFVLTQPKLTLLMKYVNTRCLSSEKSTDKCAVGAEHKKPFHLYSDTQRDSFIFICRWKGKISIFYEALNGNLLNMSYIFAISHQVIWAHNQMGCTWSNGKQLYKYISTINNYFMD